ncbi:hypothetical protein ACFFMR_29375 [Micromonospora andamanensis]|uniref:MinD-like ATPase involved in chromosome partitioning or flagellar assembly n=1 Tax=Micromonospora andamanensis TaxID=1287068 RepID=A0ABQ4HRX6_9ACTN|nr:hypothetical protein [Micromonospora andamanensis]GIJ08396.1 hypothetical protein Van01_16100 [Micromonospora andamanensis]
MLVVVASVSGAAGVSTVALGLAALWPSRKGLLVEADPCGGVVAARFGLPQEPGLTGFAAAARHGLPEGGSARFVQVLPVGVHAVVGPGAAETAAQAVSVLAGRPETVAALAPVVVVDAGRLYPGSPAHGLLGAADALVVVTAGDTEHLDHVENRLTGLRASTRSGGVGLAVCGKTPFAPQDISARCRAPVWAHLPRDRWGAAGLSGRMTGPAWPRTRLAQALRSLAGILAVPPQLGRPRLEVLR